MSSLTNVIDQSSLLHKTNVFSPILQVMCLVSDYGLHKAGLGFCLLNSPTWPLYFAGPFKLFTSSHIT